MLNLINLYMYNKLKYQKYKKKYLLLKNFLGGKIEMQTYYEYSIYCI